MSAGGMPNEAQMSILTTKRPPRMAECPAEVAVHWIMTPRMKIQVLTRIAYFLEMISARKPEYRVPVQAPNSRMEVSQPFLVVLLT